MLWQWSLAFLLALLITLICFSYYIRQSEKQMMCLDIWFTSEGTAILQMHKQ